MSSIFAFTSVILLLYYVLVYYLKETVFPAHQFACKFGYCWQMKGCWITGSNDEKCLRIAGSNCIKKLDYRPPKKSDHFSFAAAKPIHFQLLLPAILKHFESLLQFSSGKQIYKQIGVLFSRPLETQFKYYELKGQYKI